MTTPGRHYVYTMWADRKPLYVGCTSNLRQRMAQHRASGVEAMCDWVAIVEFSTLADARSAEVERIQKIRPRLNVQHLCQHRDAREANYLQALFDESLPVEQMTTRDRKLHSLRAMRSVK